MCEPSTALLWRAMIGVKRVLYLIPPASGLPSLTGTTLTLRQQDTGNVCPSDSQRSDVNHCAKNLFLARVPVESSRLRRRRRAMLHRPSPWPQFTVDCTAASCWFALSSTACRSAATLRAASRSFAGRLSDRGRRFHLANARRPGWRRPVPFRRAPRLFEPHLAWRPVSAISASSDLTCSADAATSLFVASSCAFVSLSLASAAVRAAVSSVTLVCRPVELVSIPLSSSVSDSLSCGKFCIIRQFAEGFGQMSERFGDRRLGRLDLLDTGHGFGSLGIAGGTGSADLLYFRSELVRVGF